MVMGIRGAFMIRQWSFVVIFEVQLNDTMRWTRTHAPIAQIKFHVFEEKATLSQTSKLKRSHLSVAWILDIYHISMADSIYVGHTGRVCDWINCISMRSKAINNRLVLSNGIEWETQDMGHQLILYGSFGTLDSRQVSPGLTSPSLAKTNLSNWLRCAAWRPHPGSFRALRRCLLCTSVTG